MNLRICRNVSIAKFIADSVFHIKGNMLDAIFTRRSSMNTGSRIRTVLAVCIMALSTSQTVYAGETKNDMLSELYESTVYKGLHRVGI